MSVHARPAPRQLWLVWLGVSAVVFALLLTTAAGISVTWDEPIYSQAAENAARWFGTLVQGGPGAAFAQTAFGVGWGLVNEHPPLVRVLNGFGWALTRGILPAPTVHRLGSMLLAALTIGVLAAATARRSGLVAGLFAAAAVVTMPRVFFHAHLGALDFPHAATWFLATLAFYYAASSRRWRSWRWHWSASLVRKGSSDRPLVGRLARPQPFRSGIGNPCLTLRSPLRGWHFSG